MYGVRHRLSEDFPEYRDTIEQLRMCNSGFARLLDKYHQMDKTICGFERTQRPVADIHVEELKKWRLRIKDELYSMLRTQSPASTRPS